MMPNQPQRTTLQPTQIQHLAQNYKLELQKCQAAGGQNSPGGREHFLRAQRIKQVLVNYQQQQQQLRNRAMSQQQQQPASSMNSPQPVSGAPSPQVNTPTPPTGSTQSRLPVILQQFQRIKQNLGILSKKVGDLIEAKKQPNLTPEVVSQLDQQLEVAQKQYEQTKNAAIHLAQQIKKQQFTQAPQGASSPAAQTPVSQPQQPSQSQPALNQAPPPQPSRQNTPNPIQANTPVTSVNAAARPSGPGSGPNGLSPGLSGEITKSSVPSLPISQNLNVKPPQPVSTRLNNRPTALGGNAINAPPLTTPSMVRPPQFEMDPDRVLQKRKLRELVRSVGADEGDGETDIDGDVEELLLDLADEFVTSVTGFACRLAKHRKVESLDVKDVQLHLERNWNMKIPGYASDEIRSIRRFQPTQAYNQKVSGVDISKAVNK